MISQQQAKNLELNILFFLRENMAPFEIKNHIKYFDGRKVTKPDLIFSQCISTYKAYSQMKIFSGVKIINIGSLRMSSYLKAIKKLRKKKSTRNKAKNKNIIFFSFPYNSLLEFYKNPPIKSFGKDGLVNFFKNSHNSIIEYAMKNKNVNLTIKTKWAFKWHKIIKNNWYKYSNDSEIPNNVKITAEGNVHHMILKADLVVSFFPQLCVKLG